MARRDRKALHETLSGIPVEPLYSPETTPLDYGEALGDPGTYPYTRGPYGTMHRGQLWTMRMFAGFGTAEETNERFRYLLEQGQTGLSARSGARAWRSTRSRTWRICSPASRWTK